MTKLLRVENFKNNKFKIQISPKSNSETFSLTKLLSHLTLRTHHGEWAYGSHKDGVEVVTKGIIFAHSMLRQ